MSDQVPSKGHPRERRLIESDAFPIEFVSELAEMESWRKEVYRPIYHIHKWWAKRLGSVFRAILLGSALPESENLVEAFYRQHDFAGLTVFDPFMGSGTTVGEAHKLGFTALGRDINPVACESVRVSLGSLDYDALMKAFGQLSAGVGERIRALYHTEDAAGHICDALYFFLGQNSAMSCLLRERGFISDLHLRSERLSRPQTRSPRCLPGMRRNFLRGCQLPAGALSSLPTPV
jgi:putative DNA methylase